MDIDILTLFPKMFEGVLDESILKRAAKKGIAQFRVHNLRDWTNDAHKTADDKPFGGGAGMVMKVEPIFKALVELKIIDKSGNRSKSSGTKVILMTPQGATFKQPLAKKMADLDRLVIICGHYEGIDERVNSFIDEEISIGDYVLTCGELPAMVVIDSVVRLIPGVVGDEESIKDESFEDGLLEYPHYTRPSEFMGMKVPDVLLSGDHKRIAEWRNSEAIKRTIKRRPDLVEAHGSQKADKKAGHKISRQKRKDE